MAAIQIRKEEGKKKEEKGKSGREPGREFWFIAEVLWELLINLTDGSYLVHQDKLIYYAVSKHSFDRGKKTYF